MNKSKYWQQIINNPSAYLIDVKSRMEIAQDCLELQKQVDELKNIEQWLRGLLKKSRADCNYLKLTMNKQNDLMKNLEDKK